MKKIISLVLSVMLIFGVVPITSASSDLCGENVTWSYDETTKTLNIEGTGNMYGEFDDGQPWANCVEDIVTVNVGDGVTEVNDTTFWYMSSLETVNIGDSVEYFYESYFDYCYSLLNVNFSAENTYYKSIDGVVFDSYNSLVLCPVGKSGTYTIPAGTENIGFYAFENCVDLTSVIISDSVTTISDSAFYGCESLESVTIPDSVTSIGESAFSSCISLESITIPGAVTDIGDSAFDSCTALTQITIPDSVTSIGIEVFYNCTSLTAINVSDNNKYYCSLDGVLFNKGKTELIQYPVGKQAVEYTIPESVAIIGGYAFYGCETLTKVNIPNSVVSIGQEAFSSCVSIAEFAIPDSVTNIGAYAFYGTEYYNDSENWENNVLYIGNCLIEAYDISGNYAIKSDTKLIANNAFAFCNLLESVAIGNSVTKISNGAFEYCELLKSVTIPASVTSIEDDAFYGCDALTDVYYAGSESDWGSIAIGESNESLTNAAIHYNAGEEQPTTTTTTTTTTTANPIGDADGNGVVNVMDIQIIKKCVVNTDFAENYTDTADINEDGKITSVDILMLKKIITNGEV